MSKDLEARAEMDTGISSYLRFFIDTAFLNKVSLSFGIVKFNPRNVVHFLKKKEGQGAAYFSFALLAKRQSFPKVG